MKLGSLFDGIGGFPLAGSRHGITPVWASEIEAGPMAITKKHFPDMIHLGDVTKINGAAVEPVDVITFGSPCQDLSVAGKRAGLDGARSGLFMEAVRIIKEMRDATDGPRFAVWENVPGAFSSNSGEDFRVVIEELCHVADEAFEIPSAPKGKWEPAGLVEGDGWSVAWRVLDAQYWGVPQRRKRIFVVADFAGSSAGQVLFERESLRGDPAAGESAGQGTPADAERGARTAIPILEPGARTGKSTSDIRAGIGIGSPGDPMYTLQATKQQGVAVTFDPKDLGRRSATFENQSPTLKRHCGNTPITIAIRGREGSFNCESRQDGTANAILTPNGGRGGVGCGAIAHGYKVRRLTPTECERLQGFPDGWTEGFPDTVRYKALGNSVAVPCVEFVMEGIVREWVLS